MSSTPTTEMSQVFVIPAPSPGTCWILLLSWGSTRDPALGYFCTCTGCRQLQTRWPGGWRASRTHHTHGHWQHHKTSTTEASGLPKIQTFLVHGHSLTGGTDKLTALKDKSGKEALKKKPCPHVLCILLLSILQNAQKTPALLRWTVGQERDRTGWCGCQEQPQHPWAQHWTEPWAGAVTAPHLSHSSGQCTVQNTTAAAHTC